MSLGCSERRNEIATYTIKLVFFVNFVVRLLPGKASNGDLAFVAHGSPVCS